MAPLPFETQFSQALADNIIPGAVLRAKSRDGRIDYTENFGPWDTKTTIFPLMSMTKLLTGIAAAQVLDQGLITLETDVSPLVPVLAAQPILTGFDADGAPLLRKRQNTITFRHLLTHAVGQTLPPIDPDVTGRYQARAGVKVVPLHGAYPIEECFGSTPLLFEPGDEWRYGPGVDWAGVVIEKLTGVSLEAYMRVHIFEPLGIRDLTFFPARHPGMVERIAKPSVRDEATGAPVPAAPGYGGVIVDLADIRHCHGGSGLYGSLEEYYKVLESLLLDDEKLLSKETTASLIFQQQLRAEPPLEMPAWTVSWVPQPTEGYTWSLAGLLTPAGKLHRGKGFLQWGGMYNSSWVSGRTRNGAE